MALEPFNVGLGPQALPAVETLLERAGREVTQAEAHALAAATLREALAFRLDATRPRSVVGGIV